MQTEYVARGLRIDSKIRNLTGHKLDKLAKQARRSAKKLQTHRRRAAHHEQEGEFWSHEVLREGKGDESSGPRIVESKRIRVKPMTVDEAALELQASGHSEFVVFREPKP